jgi:type II secretory pathway pseudopilin PulG
MAPEAIFGMSSDMFNVVLALVGIVASTVLSIIFYRRGLRASDAQMNELLEQLRGMLAQRAEEVGTPPREADSGAAPVPRPSATAKAPDAAVELLVLASLGALLNERGEVNLSRLFRDVGQALGTPKYREVAAALKKLRDEGSVAWDGPDDLTGVEQVRVVAPRQPEPAR